MLTEKQLAYMRYWIILLLVAEGIMLFYNRELPLVYLIISFLFFADFMLRVLKLYPGKKEPLILDFSAVLIAVGFAYVANVIKMSGARFFLIFVSSVIILPHIIYIMNKKDA